jgi:hypothetical protein
MRRRILRRTYGGLKAAYQFWHTVATTGATPCYRYSSTPLDGRGYLVAHIRRPKGRLPFLAYSGNYWCYTVLTLFIYAPLRGAGSWVAHIRQPKGCLPILAYSGNYWCYTVLTLFIYAPLRGADTWWVLACCCPHPAGFTTSCFFVGQV